MLCKLFCCNFDCSCRRCIYVWRLEFVYFLPENLCSFAQLHCKLPYHKRYIYIQIHYLHFSQWIALEWWHTLMISSKTCEIDKSKNFAQSELNAPVEFGSTRMLYSQFSCSFNVASSHSFALRNYLLQENSLEASHFSVSIVASPFVWSQTTKKKTYIPSDFCFM